MQELSSRLTLFYKVIFPAAWLGVFSLITLAMFVAPASFEGSYALDKIRWIFVALTASTGAGLFWLLVPLKVVSMGDGTLRVSNFRRDIEIRPLDVERVTGTILLSPERVSLHLRSPTVFGSTIVFMPKLRLGSGFTRHPVVAELGAWAAERGTPI